MDQDEEEEGHPQEGEGHEEIRQPIGDQTMGSSNSHAPDLRAMNPLALCEMR